MNIYRPEIPNPYSSKSIFKLTIPKFQLVKSTEKLTKDNELNKFKRAFRNLNINNSNRNCELNKSLSNNKKKCILNEASIELHNPLFKKNQKNKYVLNRYAENNLLQKIRRRIMSNINEIREINTRDKYAMNISSVKNSKTKSIRYSMI